jgi:hypothetical protein
MFGMPLVNHLITSQVTIISFYVLKGISAYTFPSFQKKKEPQKKGKEKTGRLQCPGPDTGRELTSTTHQL